VIRDGDSLRKVKAKDLKPGMVLRTMCESPLINFKNELERRIFEIAKRFCGKSVLIDHNKTLRIEVATSLPAFLG
jgi:hypothetical protein